MRHQRAPHTCGRLDSRHAAPSLSCPVCARTHVTCTSAHGVAYDQRADTNLLAISRTVRNIYRMRDITFIFSTR